MTQAEFENALRILSSIDRHELVAAGVIAEKDGGAWASFRADPYRWRLRADDDAAGRLWRLIESRQRHRRVRRAA
jgi:hypothetical protein